MTSLELLIQKSVEGEFCQHDSVVTVMLCDLRRASPKHYDNMTGGANYGGGRRTRLGINVVCSSGAPTYI